jgi:hypothetical protein
MRATRKEIFSGRQLTIGLDLGIVSRSFVFWMKRAKSF